MNNYITGRIIKELRERKNLTQLELANIICVSDKAISKWETGRGLPDISLIEVLAKSLDVSIIELINGEYVTNRNKSSNMLKSSFAVCPICGNIIHSMGENINSCCGINLPILEAEREDDKHIINMKLIDNGYYISLNHEMTKNHYISFIAYITMNKSEIVKLYPEQNAEARFSNNGKGIIYVYCNKDGLYKKIM